MPEFTVEVPDGRLDIGLCVRSGQVFRWRQTEPGVWFGSDGPTWYRVHTGSELRVETNADREAFESYFRLDWDAEEIEAQILKRGPELEPYMRELRGLRLLRPACAVEAFYGFLCTPNNNLTRIVKMNDHLSRHAPIVGREGGEAVHGFPGTEEIARLDEAMLREQAFGYRAATIPHVARQVLGRGGDSHIESLRGAAYAEVHAELLTITGIGPKLADCICLFALDHTEAVPVDTHIWQAATRLFFPEWRDESLTGARYRAVGDALRSRFGKLAGWAQQYLFYENLLKWRERKAQSG